MPSPRKAAKTAAVKAVVTPVPEASNDAAETAPVKAAKTDKADKPKKPKLVRDSFTIPKNEYALLDALKLRAARLGQPAKKSEVLRAGVLALTALSDEALLASLAAVPRVKTGRPAKG
jgi:hypothetical protein